MTCTTLAQKIMFCSLKVYFFPGPGPLSARSGMSNRYDGDQGMYEDANTASNQPLAPSSPPWGFMPYSLIPIE